MAMMQGIVGRGVGIVKFTWHYWREFITDRSATHYLAGEEVQMGDVASLVAAQLEGSNGREDQRWQVL